MSVGSIQDDGTNINAQLRAEKRITQYTESVAIIENSKLLEQWNITVTFSVSIIFVYFFRISAIIHHLVGK